MTNKRTDDWFPVNPGPYRQQKIVNPGSGQSPNNARFSVWHFSKLYNLYKFENPERWQPDGRGKRGEPTVYPFLCNVQPLGTLNSEKDQYFLEQLRQADRTKALIVVTYDPFITNANNNLYTGALYDEPMYPEGIFIRLGGQRSKIGEALGNNFTSNDLEVNHAHADLLEYDGQLWQAVWTDYHNGGDEDIHGYTGRIAHAVMSRFEDRAHERHASVTNRDTFDGVT